VTAAKAPDDKVKPPAAKPDPKPEPEVVVKEVKVHIDNPAELELEEQAKRRGLN
jgi:hypothetical protein